MKAQGNIDSKLAKTVAKDIFYFGDLGFLIKVINGPFLYANDGFYLMMKDFVKTKDVVGKTPEQVFIKNCLPHIQNEDALLKSVKSRSFDELYFRKNNKVKVFFYIKFRISKSSVETPGIKNLIAILLLEIPRNKIKKSFNHRKDKFKIQNIKISKLIKTVKEMSQLDENNVKGRNKLQKVIQQIESLSNRDFLTNLYNRYAFEDILKLELKKSLRLSYAICILVIDIDNFKSVNDNYGHVCGDQILKELSKVLVNAVRETDYTCRWGGEEFVIILPKCNLQNAYQVSEKILKVIRRHPFKPTKITVSIGIAELKHNESISSWFIRADKALLQAKREGKNRISISQR